MMTCNEAGIRELEIEKEGAIMRMNIEIDGRLLRKAMHCSGSHSIKETIEAGLRLLVEIQAQTSIRRLRGKVRWSGNLQHSRSSRF